MAADMGVEAGRDGLLRCWWCHSAPDYVQYHDLAWGRPIHDDRALFEMLALESFQSGLSWLTILRKREGFRLAFDEWEVDEVAAYGQDDVERLLSDRGIVRHRGKIEATIANAAAVPALREEGETLDSLLWGFAPVAARRPPRSGHDLVPATPESEAMARELRRRGFRFVGPKTAYSLMQAAGLVNDHLEGCAFRGPVP